MEPCRAAQAGISFDQVGHEIAARHTDLNGDSQRLQHKNATSGIAEHPTRSSSASIGEYASHTRGTWGNMEAAADGAVQAPLRASPWPFRSCSSTRRPTPARSATTQPG